MSDQNSEAKQQARSMIAGLDETLGVKLVNASPDEVVLEYEVGPQHLQPYGIVHGGVHCAMVESACSMGAGINASTRGQSVVGLDNHTSFIKAVRSGRVRVTAKPIQKGRRTQLWEAVSTDEQGQVVASGRVRLLCLEADATLAGEKVGVRHK